MRENYPFTGTGNLVNFCKGLAAIRVQNKIFVVLDNDTAGQAALQNLGRLQMPPNIRLVRLPDLQAFRAFPKLGPSGRLSEDVDGRAVSIAQRPRGDAQRARHRFQVLAPQQPQNRVPLALPLHPSAPTRTRRTRRLRHHHPSGGYRPLTRYPAQPCCGGLALIAHPIPVRLTSPPEPTTLFKSQS
jgi:hypothetical protein